MYKFDLSEEKVSISKCKILLSEMNKFTFKGLSGPYLALWCMSPGISFSASMMALRPQSAREISARGENKILI